MAKFECSVCQKVLRTKDALKRHKINVCGIESKHPCEICSKVFTCEQYLKNHVRKLHIKPLEKDATDPLLLSKIEKMAVRRRKTNCLCQEEGCVELSIGFPNLKSFRRHLMDFHGKAMTKSTYQFASLEEFNHWKETLEIKLGISYVNYVGERKTSQGNMIKKTYLCRRSGSYKPSTSIRKRNLKTQGSCRIGHYCTSSIELGIKDDIYYVIYYEEHYGHGLDQENLAHAPLPKSAKNFVAGNLALKIPKKAILEKIRSTEGRTSLITNNDLRNIEKKITQQEQRNIEKNFNLHNLEYLHENDVYKKQKLDIYNDLNRMREIVSSQNLSLEILETLKKQLNAAESTLNASLLETPCSSKNLSNVKIENIKIETPLQRKSTKAKRKIRTVAVKAPSENEKAVLSLYLDQGKNYEIEEFEDDNCLHNISDYPFEQGHVEIVIN